MKITIHSRSLTPFCNGKLTIEVEAVKVTMPGFGWMDSAYATPFIDDAGHPTEQWTITDLVTGGSWSEQAFPSIDAAVEAMRLDFKRRRLTKGALAEIQRKVLQRGYALRRAAG